MRTHVFVLLLALLLAGYALVTFQGISHAQEEQQSPPVGRYQIAVAADQGHWACFVMDTATGDVRLTDGSSPFMAKP